METKSLKELSIQQIEKAIADAIAGLTNTDACASITLLRNDTNGVSAALTGKQTFEIALTLQVGPSYGEGGPL